MYLHLHRLNLSSFSSPIHHITTYVLWSYYSDCSRPAVIYLYMGHLLWTLVNLRRGFSVGYFHVKSVPELVDAGSTWDSFMSSQHVNIRDYKELFPVIGAALASGHIFWLLHCKLTVIIIKLVILSLIVSFCEHTYIDTFSIWLGLLSSLLIRTIDCHLISPTSLCCVYESLSVK